MTFKKVADNERDEPKMNGKDQVPFLLSHSGEGFVAKDTSICDQNMHAAKLLQSNFHDSIAVLSGTNCRCGLRSNFNRYSDLMRCIEIIN